MFPVGGTLRGAGEKALGFLEGVSLSFEGVGVAIFAMCAGVMGS